MIDFYRGRKVLITGGLGFIGSNLAIDLASVGADVTLLDSMLPDYGARVENVTQIRNQVKINFSDVRDQYSLSYLVRDQEVIFSLAGQVSHIASMTKPLTDLDINCRSQLSLLECCRQENPSARLVLAGTRQIYGKPMVLPVKEDHPINPTDVNGVNKWAAEKYYSLYSQCYGLSTICLRLTNTYGPRMDLQNSQKGFVGVFLNQALTGQKIKLFGTGEQRRDFNYVTDVTHALMLAGCRRDVSGQSFNLGHDEYFSLREFVQILSELLPTQSEIVPFPAELQSIDIGDYYADFTAFQEWTGWHPRVGLREGLRLTLSHYQESMRIAS
jgi:nucleoside-diphosphate-sugar epimerase